MPRSPGRGSLFERLDPDLPPRRTRTRQEMAAERIRAIKRQLPELIVTAKAGDSTKARERLGWRPEVDFHGLIGMMVDADIARLKKEHPSTVS